MAYLSLLSPAPFPQIGGECPKEKEVRSGFEKLSNLGPLPPCHCIVDNEVGWIRKVLA